MSVCAQCGSDVRWVVRVGARSQCQNPDGSDHWDLCAKLKFERIQRTGEHFENANATGYLTPFKPSGVLFTMLRGKTTGKPIDKKGCKDCVPPWERCPNQCPIELNGAVNG